MPKGRCTNFGNCPKADSGEIQDVPAGADFECAEPECESELLAIDTGGGGVPVPLKISALVVLAGLIGIGGWLVWPDSSVVERDVPTKQDSTIVGPYVQIDSVIKPPQTDTVHVPEHPADEEYDRVKALYGDLNVGQTEIERQWQQAELTFPDDYRFAFERARHLIWVGNTAHPFEIFHDAARKAIEQEEANAMLADLRREEFTTYGKISVDHDEWDDMIEALETNDVHELEEAPHGH